MASNVLHRRHMDTMDIMGHGPTMDHGPWVMDHGSLFMIHGHQTWTTRPRGLGPAASGLWALDHGHHGPWTPWTSWTMVHGSGFRLRTCMVWTLRFLRPWTNFISYRVVPEGFRVPFLTKRFFDETIFWRSGFLPNSVSCRNGRLTKRFLPRRFFDETVFDETVI